MSFFKPHVSFSLKYASLFSVMTQNSSAIFQLKNYMLYTKRAHQRTILQTFECSNESPPNSPCHFWNNKVRIYLNFASLFSVMKDNSSVFFSSNIIYSEQRESSKVKFLDFWMVGWKFTKILMSYLKLQVIFHHFLVSCVITVLYFFTWNFIWFKQKESIKISLNVYFDTLPLLKVHKILAKKYRESISHNTEESCKILKGTDFLFKRLKEFD